MVAQPQMERTSSIEREPRTLSIHQIQCARELAIYVMNTKSLEEASRIFTEGLKPVVSAACRMGSGPRMESDMVEELEFLKDTIEIASAFRDIASAPF
ncbi:hypothetical protein L6164_025012 [Bauhinia variegata]|uniref:Uncharacterized protein n=1 Tax=Bauhinia variegata TaxID=167791 RepID=A0ACB9LZM1_BAUVA|nr:hypothetical protein L6164_025012 [Bauhinia variegata]